VVLSVDSRKKSMSEVQSNNHHRYSVPKY